MNIPNNYKKNYDLCIKELIRSFRISLFTFNNKYTKDTYKHPYG